MKDFGEIIKKDINKLDSINNKNNNEEIKTKEKKEIRNEELINSAGKSENIKQNYFEDIYNDLSYLNYLNNSNLEKFLNPPNSFPLMFNLSENRNNNLIDMSKITEKKYFEDQILPNKNFFVINNIYNNTNINYPFIFNNYDYSNK